MNFFKNLLNPSVSSIVEDFQHKIDQLNALSVREGERANALSEEASLAYAESNRAEIVADKLESLLG